MKSYIKTHQKTLKYILLVFIPTLILIVGLSISNKPTTSNNSGISIDTPQTYKNIFGVDRPIDTTIIKASGKFDYKNTTNRFKTYFKDSPTQKESIVFRKGRSEISFFTPTSQSFGTLLPTKSKVTDNSITYQNIYPRVDLKYTVSSTRLLEEFIIKDATTAKNLITIDQKVSTKNIDSHNLIDGGISFYRNSQLIYSAPKPVMYELNNSKNNSYGIEYLISEQSESKLTVSKSINQEGLDWLSDPDRQYPIVIDLVIDNADTAASWVSSDATNTVVTQETTIKQEGTGSVKVAGTGRNIDLGDGADGALNPTVSYTSYYSLGDGADSALAPTGTFNLNTSTSGARSYADGIAYRVIAPVSGATTVTRYSGSDTISNGIVAGDEVLVINLQGTTSDYSDVGMFEFAQVQSITSSVITFTSGLFNNYTGTTASNQKVIVQRVPNYTSVTLDSGDSITASDWEGLATTPSGTAGYLTGIAAFRANGTVSVGSGASITTSGMGFRGGATACGGGAATQGESYGGTGVNSRTPNLGGGSGGGGAGESGGGGGHASTGGTGTGGNVGGSAYGSAHIHMNAMFFGSGGGGGDCGGSNGGDGGGIVFVMGSSVSVIGTIYGNGNNGLASSGYDNGGGGGSGGTTTVGGASVTAGSNLVRAAGGSGSEGGGSGSSGYLDLRSDSVTGTTTPTAISTGFDLTISTSGGRDYADGIAYRVDASTATGTTIDRYDTNSDFSNGISSGDEVILINLQGTSSDYADVGNYEYLEVQSVTSSQITFSTSIQESYDGTTASNQKVVVQRVPNYTSVTLDSTDSMTSIQFESLSTAPANTGGYRTGLVVFRTTGAVTIGSGTSIDMQLQGYDGGPYNYGNIAYQGDSYSGDGVTSHAANGGGGAGGGEAGESGGGAGYVTTGGTGTGGNPGGTTYGETDLRNTIFHGSGGGAGDGNWPSGGEGGGMAIIIADTVTVSGTINANGENGMVSSSHSNGSGGGAGGSILIETDTSATVGTSLVSAAGTSGGEGGGAGSVGRIAIISDSISGTTNPSAYTTSIETGSLDDTTTLTKSSTDISGNISLTFYVRSDKTGSFSRFQFGESTSSEQTYDITIDSADTWEQKTWDISGIADASRDQVTKFAFKFTDSPTDFTYYFDDIQTLSNNFPPSTPSLDAPTDVATNQLILPALKTTTTDPDSDYLRYKIDICENVGMSTNCQTFTQTGGDQTGWSGQNAETSTAYTSGTQATYTIQSGSPLVAGTTYYWRSYAIDPAGENTWSSTQGTPYSFTVTTTPTAPTTPYAEGATNPTGVSDLTPEFSAIHNDPDADSADYYQIEVDTQVGFDGTQMWDSTKTSMTTTADTVRSPDISYAGTALSMDGTTYYWRIKFWDVNGAEGVWSATQNFSMNSGPTTPSLDVPTDTAINQSLAPALKTTTTDSDSDYLRYKIDVCENISMSTNCNTYTQTSGNQTGWSGQDAETSTAYASGTQATYTIQTTLDTTTTYYWRSYAIDPAGTNAWSSTQGTPYSFTTKDLQYTSSCSIEEADDDSSLTLYWVDEDDGEDGFDVDRSVNGAAYIDLITKAANSTFHADSTVSQGNKYQYRIRSYISTSYGEWCYTASVDLSVGAFKFDNINFF